MRSKQASGSKSGETKKDGAGSSGEITAVRNLPRMYQAPLKKEAAHIPTPTWVASVLVQFTAEKGGMMVVNDFFLLGMRR